MAFTIHFLCEDFRIHNFTLAVKPIYGKHSGGVIRNYMQEIIDDWDLSKESIVMMLRDSGSNMVKACKDWKIPHFPCIGHSLHLLVGPFLLEKKSNRIASEEIQEEDVENEEDHCDAYTDEFTDTYNDAEAIARVRKIVAKIRRTTKYIKNSTKSKELLEKNQELNECNRILRVSMDVRTRWNSTYKMLKRALDLKDPITKFLRFYKSPTGRREFSGSKTKLDDIDDRDWATISGICHLLGSFDSATKLLSGEKYSSFVTAFSVLRKIKEKIGNNSMFSFANFDVADAGNSKFKTDFYGRYGNETFFEQLVLELNSCRLLLLNDFKTRFSGMDASIVWTTLLDPRFSLGSQCWKNDAERALGKEMLIENVEDYVCDAAIASSLSNPRENNLVDIEDSSDDENTIRLFDSRNQVQTSNLVPTITVTETARVQAKQEVLMYLTATQAIMKPTFDPLNWWRDNLSRFPSVGAVARKWLSVPATSTPSERVFSICGIVDSAKRSSLAGRSIEDQVFIHNNKELIDH